MHIPTTLYVCVAEPGSAMLEHFTHLRRQWASKAHKLLFSLNKVTTAEMTEVIGISYSVCFRVIIL